MKRLVLAFLFFLQSMSGETLQAETQQSSRSLINEAQFRLYYINIYESSIYKTYHSQLQAFLQSEIEKSKSLQEALLSSETGHSFIDQGLEFIHLIFKSMPQDRFDQALQHEKFITKLRELITEKSTVENHKDPLTNAVAHLIDKLTIWMFTEADLSIPAYEFMYTETGLDQSAIDTLFQLDPFNFAIAIQTFFEGSEHFSEKEKPPEMLEDPVLYGDMPMKLFTLQNGKIEVIRTANVVRESGAEGDNRLNEEFKNYLVARPGKLHLYINLLPRTGDDSEKSTLIEDLEDDPLVKKSFAIITLPKQKASNFYFQKGEYADLNDAFQFKQAFFTVLFIRDGDFYWSKKLEIGKWRKEVLAIINAVHKDFFAKREELTVQERLDFIEIAYIKIIEAAINQLNPDVLNVTCKQSVDRGPSIYALLYMYDRLKAGSSLEEEYQTLYCLYFSPPIAFHNRPGHDYRVERFQTALNRMIPHFQKN